MIKQVYYFQKRETFFITTKKQRYKKNILNASKSIEVRKRNISIFNFLKLIKKYFIGKEKYINYK